MDIIEKIFVEEEDSFESMRLELLVKMEMYLLRLNEKNEEPNKPQVVAEFAAYTQKATKNLRKSFPQKSGGVIKGVENKHLFEQHEKAFGDLWWEVCKPIFVEHCEFNVGHKSEEVTQKEVSSTDVDEKGDMSSSTKAENSALEGRGGCQIE